MNKGIVLLLTSVALAGCGQVDAGHTGVFSRFGQVDNVPAREGLHWYNPLTTDLIVLDTQTQKGEGEASTYTRDTQLATIKYTINYSLNSNVVPQVYRQFGENWFERLGPQVIVSSIKDEFGKWNAVDAIARREVLQQRITARILPELQKRNIIVTGFELTDISYSKEFENAVEAKQVAVERANAERNKTVQVQEQAKQRIIAAEGEAKAMQLKSQAIAANPALTQYEAVQRWSGKLCETGATCMFGGQGGAVPFINVKP